MLTAMGKSGPTNLIEDNGAYQLSISEFGTYQVGNGVGTPVNLKLNSAGCKSKDL